MLISNIQRFSLSDGPGIRTTVFCMGCPLRCFWCSNPENLTPEIKYYKKNGIMGHFGQEYSLDELVNILIKDKVYYAQNGGVTFSGGECLLVLKDNIDLLKKLKKENINICIESSLCVPVNNLSSVIEYIDTFIIDLKVFTENAKKINIDIDKIYTNLKILKKFNDATIFRIPLVKGFNDDEKNLKIIKKIIFDFNPSEVEVFQIHNLGKSKYESLNMTSYAPEYFKDEEIDKIISFIGFERIKKLSI